MKKNEFIKIITEKLRFIPTQGQKQAIELFAAYMCCQEKASLMLLKGYAGTGKTSLVSAFVRTLSGMGIKTVLLAPTGRAAKVLGHYARKQAFTIHKEIYRIEVDKDGIEHLALKENEYKNTIFFVDEASMIYDVQSSHNTTTLFQETNLLFNLFSYVEAGTNCRLILIGDTAQLPPVGLQYSPALDKDFLKDNLSRLVFDCELKEVVRQVQKSGILYNANQIRSLTETESIKSYVFVTEKFKDVACIPVNELPEKLETFYKNNNYDNVLVITRSNKQANQLNQTIRANILYREEQLEKGDYLMNLKNNYFWLLREKETKFIANGDIMEIVRVKNIEQRYGFCFADVRMRLPDYEMDDVDVKLILDTLYADAAAMTNESRKELYNAVCLDYAHLRSVKKRYQAIRKDPFLNALQVKFAYAQTCHKAQGGQWDTVFIYQGYVPDNSTDNTYYRWMYTAVTRAKKQLFLVQ